MSARQCQFVENNLPLVYLTLRRHRYLTDHHRAGREPKELFQEGSLALMEAVRMHDPIRHGEFAAFAMARIHFAISRYVHEYTGAIRVPFITQRRRKKNREEKECDRHRPAPLPRVVSMKDGRHGTTRLRTSIREVHHASSVQDEVTIGDMIRERFDRAMREVARDMKNSPRCTQDNSDVIERCLEERWSVPEPTARTSIRQLAKSLSCSAGRVTYYEERFRKKLAAALNGDETYRTLTRIAKLKPEGWRHCLGSSELAGIAAPYDKGRSSDL